MRGRRIPSSRVDPRYPRPLLEEAMFSLCDVVFSEREMRRELLPFHEPGVVSLSARVKHTLMPGMTVDARLLAATELEEFR